MVLLWMLMAFAAIVVSFHLSELLFAWYYHRETFSFDSALISRPYLIMMAFTLTEFVAESIWTPALKLLPISLFGVALAFGGELVRKSAMITAGRAFTHQIATERRTGHELVTHGIYRLSRHPGYAGWFWWAIGAQIVICNPLATVIAGIIGWRVLRQRITYEEGLLREWFGPEYNAYRNRTPTGIPFIR